MSMLSKLIERISKFGKKKQNNKKTNEHLKIIEEDKIEIIPAVNKDEDKEIAENITISTKRGDSLEFQDDINNDHWLTGQSG